MVHQAKPREGEPDISIGPIKRFGRYTLIKKLATGGMAEIWLARQSGVAGFNRFVVIKKILSHLAEEETFRNMFLDEARMSALLSHPNIVQVYDLGQADQTYFIAMEFIMGENLAAIAWRGVKRSSPVSPSFAARIMADACKALHYAHHMRGTDGQPLEIVHRDISPQNILVTYEGEVKVVDFGIAKAASKSQHTKTGMLKGKFSYMSPEQCLGTAVDKRSDVFALGIVLYELCTGKRLFKHESELMILEMITKRRITPPSEVSPDIVPELEQIILRALEKDPAQRYQSAQDLQLALEDFIRASGAAATNADIATYMRGLFGDKIEEKRKIRELASREDLSEIASFEDEATERANEQHLARMSTNPRVQYGTPSQPAVHMNGPRAVGITHTGAVAGLRQGQQATREMGAASAVPSFDPRYPAALSGLVQGVPLSSMAGGIPGGAITEERSWLPKVIILLALTVIVVAGTYLYQELTRESLEPLQEPQAPTSFGHVEIDSKPAGAAIFVNDNPVRLEDGSQARTPIAQLAYLAYGQSYTIKLRKEGYEDYTLTLLMGDKSDGQRIAAELKATPGKLVVEVSGPEGRHVRVYFDGVDQGLGPRIEAMVQKRVIHVTAELADRLCTATPEDVEVKAGGSAFTTVRCVEKRTHVAVRDPQRNLGRQPRDEPRQAPPPKPQSPGGCGPTEGLPPGYATIDTVPFSEIFLDGKRIGETPLAKQKFPCCCVQIEAKAQDGRTKKYQLRLEPNVNKTYRFSFDAPKDPTP